MNDNANREAFQAYQDRMYRSGNKLQPARDVSLAETAAWLLVTLAVGGLAVFCVLQYLVG